MRSLSIGNKVFLPLRTITRRITKNNAAAIKKPPALLLTRSPSHQPSASVAKNKKNKPSVTINTPIMAPEMILVAFWVTLTVVSL